MREGGREDRWVGDRTRQQQRMSEERDRQTDRVTGRPIDTL